MRSPLTAAAPALAALTLLALPTLAHEDARLGYRIKPPRGWNEVPTKPTESYIVAKFKSDKTEYHRDPEFGNTYQYQPEMVVIAFIDDEFRKESTDVEGDEVVIDFNPFPDYMEYIQGTRSGFYQLTDPEYDEHSGVPVEKLEFSVNDGVFRMVTWIFELEVGKVAVQLDCFEDNYKKNKSAFRKTLRSFKPIERTEDLDSLLRGTALISIFGLDDLEPDERKIRRQEMERTAWEAATADLPDGWDALDHKGVPILTHGDEKHAKKMAEQVRAVMDWLTDNFAEIGEGEYVRTPILRVCEDETEYGMFQRGFSFGSNEIVTYRDNSGAMSYTWENVNRGALRAWFRDRDRHVYRYLPPWLDQGLPELIGVARPKGSRLDFPEKDWERAFVRAAKSGDITPCRELMTMPYDLYAKDATSRLGESFALTRFFLTDRKNRELLAEYLVNLRDVVHEVRAKEAERREKEGDTKPKNEEEEAELERRERERAEQNRQTILDEAVARTFGSWDENDWASLDKSFVNSL